MERQTRLTDFFSSWVRFVYVPIRPTLTVRRGLSERQLRRRLERQGWDVWRGGFVDAVRRDVYPNIRRRYNVLVELLRKHYPGLVDYMQYLCSVNHGMPDFICYRNGKFKFVECKLGYESLSSRQKVCISKLQDMGFKVEIHKVVGNPTKVRLADVNLEGSEKIILEKQARLYK